MTLLLTLSTFVTISPGIFFAFVIINGIVQAAAGSYLQTATIQVASLFGPHTVQAMFTGQGAVAVVVSGVQVASATVSTWGASQETISTYVLGDGSAEERSAFIFFGLSTLFLLFSLAAHAWLVSMPIYKTVAAPLEHKAITGSTTDEIQGLVSGHRHEFHDEKKRIMRVARLNVTYEVAVAYVFIVTLVSTRSSVNRFNVFIAVHRLSSLQSPLQCKPPTQPRTLCSSVLSISSCSISAISLADIFARSLDFSFGTQSAF